jgi:hypothetical protein
VRERGGGVCKGFFPGCCWAAASGRAKWLRFFFFFLFWFFFFLFSVLLHMFCILAPNLFKQFVNFCKIQSVKARQSGTSFQNKIRFSIKPYEF